MEELLKIASLVQANNKDEAEAIKGYTDLLAFTMSSNISSEDKQVIADTINEIISDELNHQKRLSELYTKLTNIKANEV